MESAGRPEHAGGALEKGLLDYDWVEGTIGGKVYRIVREPGRPGEPRAKRRPRFFELVDDRFGDKVPRECPPPSMGELVAELERCWERERERERERPVRSRPHLAAVE